VSIVFYGGFRRRFLLLFSEKRRVGDFRVFGSFSEKERVGAKRGWEVLREGVVRFINKLHLSLYIHKWIGKIWQKEQFH